MKLESNFSEHINKNKSKKFKILMVIEPEFDINNLSALSHNKIMHNIISAELTGDEIIELSKASAISSIELDGDVSIL